MEQRDVKPDVEQSSTTDAEARPTPKRPRIEDTGEILRVLIPSRAAGALIGKGGETVKRLRNDFNADVSIADSLSPERIFVISAPDVDAICGIVLEVLAKLDEVNRNPNREPEFKILVHTSQAGAVIGRAGAKIKELREATGTAIKCFSECCPRSTDRVISIRGEHQKVIGALREVLKLLDTIAVKGAVRNYDTTNYELDFVEEYGGYPPEGRGSGGRGSIRGGRFDGGGRFGGRDDFDRFAGGSRPGGGDHFDFDEFLDRGMAARFRPMMDDEFALISTQQLTIPKDLAGSILGKSGDRINRIRHESGAKITLHEPEGDSLERIISITGTPGRIQYAQYLLQQCVRASAAGRRYIYEAHR